MTAPETLQGIGPPSNHFKAERVTGCAIWPKAQWTAVELKLQLPDDIWGLLVKQIRKDTAQLAPAEDSVHVTSADIERDPDFFHYRGLPEGILLFTLSSRALLCTNLRRMIASNSDFSRDQIE
jgi:hypothetical protein